MQQPAGRPLVNRRVTQAEPPELRQRNHAMLRVCQGSDLHVEFSAI